MSREPITIAGPDPDELTADELFTLREIANGETLDEDYAAEIAALIRYGLVEHVDCELRVTELGARCVR